MGQAWLDRLANTVVVRRTVNPTIRRAVSVFAMLSIFSSIGVAAYGNWSEERSKRHAAWETEISNRSDLVQQARKAADDIVALQPDNLDDWKADMVRLESALDTYNSRVDSLRASLMRGEKEDLIESDSERHQTEALIGALKLRRQQSDKQREEADMVIQFDPATYQLADLQSNLHVLDSDIEAINRRALQTLSQAGIQ
jgi:hypothetical protein